MPNILNDKANIYVLSSYDLMRTDVTDGNYYAVSDTRLIYKDTGDRRVALDVTFVNTDIDRNNNIRPSNGTLYYVWETNVLWLYNAGWVLQAGRCEDSSGYYYSGATGGNISGTLGNIVDNNGLLQDGSVVVRDTNRIIKGRLYIDDATNNLVVSSFLGGGLQILPNDTRDAKGSLLINPGTYVKTTYVNKLTGESFSADKFVSVEDSDLFDEDGTTLNYSSIYFALDGLGKLPPDITEDNLEDNETVLDELYRTYLIITNYEEIAVKETTQNGYALYNGEFNTTDEIYVNKRYALSTEQLKLLDLSEEDSANDIFTQLQKAGVIKEDADRESYTAQSIFDILSSFKEKAYSPTPPKYKVWHEGNLNPDKVFSASGILKTIQQLEGPLELDVTHLDGHVADDFALKFHNHPISEIYHDGEYQDIDKFGIGIVYDTDAKKFIVRPKSFTIALSGDISGSITVNNLSDVAVDSLQVNADRHYHRIVSYNKSNNTYTFVPEYQDLQDYILSKVASTGLQASETTKVAVPNKILYLDRDAKLPADITGSATSLSNKRKISIIGDATGTAREVSNPSVLGFDGSKDVEIELTIDFSKHTHDNYILKSEIGNTVAPLDSNKVVPDINLPDDIKGCLKKIGTWDVSSGEFCITSVTSYSVNSTYYTENGLTVPTKKNLTNNDFKFPITPDRYEFDSTLNKYYTWIDGTYYSLDVVDGENKNLPTPTKRGQYWVVKGNSVLNSVSIKTNDWIIWDGKSWDILFNGTRSSGGSSGGTGNVTSSYIRGSIPSNAWIYVKEDDVYTYSLAPDIEDSFSSNIELLFDNDNSRQDYINNGISSSYDGTNLNFESLFLPEREIEFILLISSMEEKQVA